MRNCNLTKYGYGFMQGITVTYLYVHLIRWRAFTGHLRFIYVGMCLPTEWREPMLVSPTLLRALISFVRFRFCKLRVTPIRKYVVPYKHAIETGTSPTT